MSAQLTLNVQPAGACHRAGRRRGCPSGSPRSGSTASCCTSWSGARSRSATSRRRSASPGRSFSRSSRWSVFTLFFGRLAGLPSDGLPYPVFAFCALLPWQLFAFALTESSNSVVANQRLITKVYFPRLILPLAGVCVGLADFAVRVRAAPRACSAYYGADARAGRSLTVPLWTLLALATALGVGLWLSALNVRYRDVRYTLPFLTQIWLFATPVAYSSVDRAGSLAAGRTRSIRWWASSTASAGRCSVRRRPGPTVLVSSSAVLRAPRERALLLPTVERTFADIV